MAFSMPIYDQITDDQWEVQDLPISGRFMVTGGPGSGKTLIAIRRTQTILEDNPDSKVCTFLSTKTLKSYFQAAIESLDIESNVLLWAQWQREVLKQHKAWPWEYGEPVPWETLSKRIISLGLGVWFDHLIIDEGQDFSNDDLKLMSSIADNITVFADLNQRLRDKGVETEKELKECLNINDDDTYHLKENHRNTKEIMEAAVSLAPDEIDVDLDEIQRKNGKKPLLIEHENADDEINYIAKVLRNIFSAGYDVGIIVLKKENIYEFNERLKKELGGKIEIQIKKDQIDFNNVNPKICTFDSAKGLEFDVVIMPKLDKNNYFEDKKKKNLKRFYVGMTRAKYDLILSYVGKYPTAYIGKIDPNTIRRHTNQLRELYK